jgi:hypothetical protein
LVKNQLFGAQKLNISKQMFKISVTAAAGVQKKKLKA